MAAQTEAEHVTIVTYNWGAIIVASIIGVIAFIGIAYCLYNFISIARKEAEADALADAEAEGEGDQAEESLLNKDGEPNDSNKATKAELGE